MGVKRSSSAEKSDASPFDISNVTEIDHEEEVMDYKQIEKSLNKESEDNKLIQNTKEFDFTAPLEVGETAARDERRTNSNSNSITNTQRGVKFLSDYAMQKSAHNPAREPLLQRSERSGSPSGRGAEETSRFKISHVHDPKNKLFKEAKPKTESKYFLSEDGKILMDKDKSNAANEQKSQETHEAHPDGIKLNFLAYINS